MKSDFPFVPVHLCRNLVVFVLQRCKESSIQCTCLAESLNCFNNYSALDCFNIYSAQ